MFWQARAKGDLGGIQETAASRVFGLNKRWQMLRNAPLRSKLIVTLVCPLLALIVLAAVVIRSSLVESGKAAEVNQRARFAAKLAPLIHALQAERSLSSSYVASGRHGPPTQLSQQRHTVDQVAATYRAAAARLDLGGDPGLRDRVGYGMRELDKLSIQRRAIDAGPIDSNGGVEPEIDEGEIEGQLDVNENHGPITDPPEAIEQYTDTINDLLDINTEIAPGSNNARLIEEVRASVALARAKEFADHQRGLLYDVLSKHAFGPGQYGKLTSLRAVEVIYIAQFESAATPAEVAVYRHAIESPEIARIDHMREEAVDSGGQGHVDGDPRAWFQATSVQLDQLRGLEQRLSADVVATSASIKAAADRRALLYIVLLIAAIVLAVGLSLVVARSLIVRLSRLKDVAHEVAESRLPGVVNRLREGESVDLETASAMPIDSHARDEIGQLGEAFSLVHRVALQVAGREAALRRSVGDMFLNLARRSQSMVERQLELIGDLGRRDLGDAMVEVSELDHLAGRMRRNAENLIVLSGAEPMRRWRGPVAVADVVRAAVDEVREHGRVGALPVQPAMVAGHAASDVVRLLAELLENALSFSAPETQALVSGQALPTSYLLEIEDQGIGMSPEQFQEVNQRLTEAPDVDLASAKMLGFFVVSQLAERHGIKVQLRHSRSGGVAALVLLPAELLAQPGAPRQAPAPAFPMERRQAVHPSRGELD
jgi:signal transduction histidine kinase